MNKYWSDIVRDLEPYRAGEQPHDKAYVKLNTNESPYPPSNKVLDAIRQKADATLRLYPDPEARELKSALADYYAVRVDNIFVGNGSDEVLAFAWLAFFADKPPITFADITYTFYPVYCGLFGIEFRTFPLSDRFEINIDAIPGKAGGVVIANPNAPTGVYLDVNRIETILKRNPRAVVIVDEAYVDFGGESCVPLVEQYDNLLVVQTFSKSRSLAGLRVGFAIGEAGLIEGLNRVKNSFNAYPLDSLAIAGAVQAIRDNTHFERCRSQVIAAREWAVSELTVLGFDVIPSRANFILVSHARVNAGTLYRELKARGVLVRYFELPKISDYIRVSIGSMDEMQTFTETVGKIIS